MLFNSFQFALFFLLVFAVHGAVPRRLRPGALLFASLLFYGLWVPGYLVLLVGTLIGNHALLRGIARGRRPRLFLAASIVFTLGILGVFKYGAFAVSLSSPLVRALSFAEPRIPSFVLPLGISFYSFEIISLAVDVHHGHFECPSFARYVLFVTFFPHLIAGPILRGNELIPQFETGGQRSTARTRRGLWLFTVGLAKKTILSDFLLLPFVNEVFGSPGAANGPVHLVAAYSFAFQIYFDFSGYSDMARGLANLLGYELPRNFEEPYLSRNPSEFWRRWHMTLSRWLRDYLYVPLGGNRSGKARTLANLLVTMVLGGLWHGAGVNFLIWGAAHGLLLVIHRLVRGEEHRPKRSHGFKDACVTLLWFQIVCVAWVPFRAATPSDTLSFLRGFGNGGYLRGWPLVPLAIVLFAGALHVLERFLRERLPRVHARIAEAGWGAALEGGLLGAIVMAAILASGAGVEFIYFQF